MPVKRRLAKARAELSHGQRLFLDSVPWPLENNDDYEGRTPGERFENSMTHCWLTSPWREDMPTGGPTARGLWAQYGAQKTTEWIAARPGTRPPAWWRFNSPGLRQRVGGIGTPWGYHQLGRGVPLVWVTKKNKNWWRDCPGPAIDPKNPPLFESAACFLDRHNLLAPGDRRRLTLADFRPVRITDVINFDDETAGET